jgi:hypothetical protein
MRNAVLTAFIFLHLCAQAQRDTVRLSAAERDTVDLQSYSTRYNPRKAILFAAVFPGAGQVYTKKYWKLPLVYGGIAGTAYAIDVYQTGYLKYRGELFFNLGNGLVNPGDLNPNTGFTTSQLRNIVDRFRRERDFMIIVMMGVYVLQMIDAHVDAHLKEFDMNPNLQVRLEPSFSNELLTGRMGGISLKIRF